MSNAVEKGVQSMMNVYGLNLAKELGKLHDFDGEAAFMRMCETGSVPEVKKDKKERKIKEKKETAGRPKKVKTNTLVGEPDVEMSDMFDEVETTASLIVKELIDIEDINDSGSDNDAKEAKKAAKEAEKEAKKAAKEAEKEAEKAAKKAAKEAEKEAEKEAKKAAKEAEKEVKKAAKDAEKAAKKAEQKAAKKSEKKVEKVMSDEEVVDMAEKVLKQMGLKDATPAVNEPTVEPVAVAVELPKAVAVEVEAPVMKKPEEIPQKDHVKRFEFNGQKYLKSQNTGIVYNLEHDAIGKWDESAKQIIFYEEDEEGEEEEEEEYEE